MNKKILIASLFATLMLLVPMTSVVGVSDVEEDCGCQVSSKSNLVKVERLLNRFEIYSKVLLVLSKHNPMIAEKSQKLLEIFDTDRFLNNDIICLSLFFIMLYIGGFLPVIELIMENFREGSILFMVFLSIHLKIENIIYGILDLMEELDCEIDIP